MKKILLSVAIVAIVMASCSKDETTGINKGNAIGFNTAVTRANQTTLANMGSFNVTATPVSAATETANYFTNLAVTDVAGTWTTGGTYYWPSYGLDFFAYSPTSLSSSVSVTKTAQTITDFIPATAAADQKDVVVAFNTGTKAANENTGVPLVFRHALSQIEVQAAKAASGTNIKIEVIGVKIAKVPSKSTFTFPTAAGTVGGAKLAQSLWATPTDVQSFAIEGSAALELTTTQQNIMFGTDNFMLIPQQLSAWTGGATPDGTYLAVYCRISQDNGAGGFTLLFPEGAAAGVYGYSAVPIGTNWLPGYKYIYKLTFLPGGGKTDPENPGGGEEILGNPIFFTVDVQPWDNAADIPIDMD